MVLAERNSELVRNGRRSRGPSPNGHGGGVAGGGTVGANTNIGNSGGAGGAGTPETSSDDDNCKLQIYKNILSPMKKLLSLFLLSN